jgi:hypothetical protein
MRVFPEPEPVRLQDRVRRLPGALVLTAGYFASLVPVVSKILRRFD